MVFTFYAFRPVYSTYFRPVPHFALVGGTLKTTTSFELLLPKTWGVVRHSQVGPLLFFICIRKRIRHVFDSESLSIAKRIVELDAYDKSSQVLPQNCRSSIV